MNKPFYDNIVSRALQERSCSENDMFDILQNPEIDLLTLVHAAYQVRKRFTGKTVSIHIINNVQNGLCSEDCGYCAQSKNSQVPIETYGMKSEEEIMEEARQAYEKGAFRYCMVFSGRKPSSERIRQLTHIIRKIKKQYPLEVCVSAGIIRDHEAKILKEAGLDRLNHNINTSETMYKTICQSHTFTDRLNTLKAARNHQLQICSGVIIGMGEGTPDIYQMANILHEYHVTSIPVNFFIPIPGTAIQYQQPLTPEYCLRVLAVFRFLNPRAEIRVAAGRELYLRDLEPFAFYIANSLFMDGYLNTKGSSHYKTLQMLRDAGFQIQSEFSLDELLMREKKPDLLNSPDDKKIKLKGKKDLHPSL